jgi:hypothetical protein
MGKHRDTETKQKIRQSLLGRKLSVEHKKKIRIRTKEALASPDIRKKISLANKGKVGCWRGKHLSDEHKKKLSLANKGKSSSKKEGWVYPEVAKEKNRIASKKLWENPEFREKCITRSLKALFHNRPTSLEKSFIELIEQHHLPYKYVGDGSMLIGYKNPDFVNVNGIKKCIEVRPREMCPIWSKCSADEYERRQKEHYKKYGWDCLVIWKEDFNKINVEELICG